MENSVNKRIAAIAETTKSIRQFALSLDFSDTAIRKIVNGETKPSYEVLAAILETYSNISSDWLIKGEGEMYKTAKEQPITDTLVNELRSELRWQRSLIDRLLNSGNKDLAKLLGNSVANGFLMAA